MKRCPTCGNTYTNDGLVFCLEDGAKLTSLSNPQSSFDPEATLHIPAERNPLPPTEAARPQGAQTFRQPATPITVPPRVPRSTRDDQTPVTATATPATAAAAPAPASKSTSPVIVAGISAIVVLLLVIAGIGIALLVRSSSDGDSGPAVENNNRAANRETTRNSSNTANDGGSYNSGERGNSNTANRNGSGTATDSLARAEAKVVRGAAVDESDLRALSREELRRLRNAVYARHGRTFDSVELQRYFDTKPWYRPRSDYTEAALTATDLANIKLIQTLENSL